MRFAFALALLLVTAFLSARLGAAGDASAAVPAPPPLGLSDWVGVEEVVDARTREVLGTEDVALRRYRKDGAEVLLACVASGGDRRVAHPPEVCLRAAGYEVHARETVPLPGVAGGAIHLEAARDGRPEQVLYWFTVGEDATGSYLGHQLETALARLGGKGVATGLVRLSTVGRREEGLRQLLDLAGELLRATR